MAKKRAIFTIEYDDEDYPDAFYAAWACDFGEDVAVVKIEEVTEAGGLFPDP